MPPIDLFLKNTKNHENKSLNSGLKFYYCGTFSNHKNVNSLLELFNKNHTSQDKLSIFTSSSKLDCINYLRNKIKIMKRQCVKHILNLRLHPLKCDVVDIY